MTIPPEYHSPFPVNPQPQPTLKRPWYKKKRFVIPLGLFAFFVVVAAVTPDPEPAATVADAPAAAEAANTGPVPCPSEYLNEGDGCVVDPAEETEEEPTEAAKPKKVMTSGQSNALNKAEDYLDYQAFSRKGLIQQLRFEDYTRSEATYAVNHVEVDWNEQAVKKAKDYLDNQSFSRSGLIHQLEFEGFTASQAKHGVSAAY